MNNTIPDNNELTEIVAMASNKYGDDVYARNARTRLTELSIALANEVIVRRNLHKAAKDFFDVLDQKGISESGKEYRIYHFGCVHIGGEKRLIEAVEKLRSELKNQ